MPILLSLGALTVFALAQDDIGIARQQSRNLTTTNTTPPVTRVPFLPETEKVAPFIVYSHDRPGGPNLRRLLHSRVQEPFCPWMHSHTCADSLGHEYGIIYDQRFPGLVITTSEKGKMEAMLGKRAVDVLGEEQGAKRRELEKRTYTMTMDGCGLWCGAYDLKLARVWTLTRGMEFCKAFSILEDTMAVPGNMSLVRQT